MCMLSHHKNAIDQNGFTIIDEVYTFSELCAIQEIIALADSERATFRKSADLFAIRQFLKEIPEVRNLLFNDKLNTLITELFGSDYFVVKSIYFDKPETSNWYVAYHQDLTISVDKKVELEGFGPWTIKQNQYAVQPPIEILKNNFTIRVHLDDTDENNGALRVINESHLKEVYRPENIDWAKETETVCRVASGGIMIMKPLLLHSSGRTLNSKRRRVIHIEFSNQELPSEIKWSERLN
jgi:ectoine hydroxylase-related dioxygenase (phytanoyl-CoA dioxygenase family)